MIMIGKRVKVPYTEPYVATNSDTLSRIAARFDTTVSELKKINRLMTDAIYPGQIIFVPDENYAAMNRSSSSSSSTPATPTDSKPQKMFPSSTSSYSIPANRIRTTSREAAFSLSPPSHKVPGRVERDVADGWMAPPRPLTDDEVKKLDMECHEKFVKFTATFLSSVQMDEVSGVLLVTPDAVMFDPDENHTLVQHHGASQYSMVVPMNCVASVSIYHDADDMKLRRYKTTAHRVSMSPDLSAANKDVKQDQENKEQENKEQDHSRSPSSDRLADASVTENTENKSENFDQNVNIEVNSSNKKICDTETNATEKYIPSPTTEDVKNQTEEVKNLTVSEVQNKEENNKILDLSVCDDKLKQDEQVVVDTETESHDKDLKASVKLPLDNNGEVCGSVNAEKKSSEKAEADVTTNKCNNLVESSTLPVYLCITVRVKVDAHKSSQIETCTKSPIRPEYWYSIPYNKFIMLNAIPDSSSSLMSFPQDGSNLMPYYWTQWTLNSFNPNYALERIIHSWSPSSCFDEDDDITSGFVVIEDGNTVEGLTAVLSTANRQDGEILNRQMSKDWEIVNIEEVKRRISQAELERLPLPELSESSSIINDTHVRQLMNNLPARAEGCSWLLVYSSSKHGFSLKTLYRTMLNIDSPTFILIRDNHEKVFGALISCAVKQSDHFYGNGESYLFTFYPEFKKYPWTGINTFFVKGNPESLCIGASEGCNGLWLDGDLYHGRTQTCQTFENELLTTEQDFMIDCIETWCFI